jgi:hypothetical protein
VGTAASEYLESPTYDCITVEYRGRGRERFISELPRIMEWMELSSHRRNRQQRLPKNIDAKSMRSGDRFFYWLEAPVLTPQVAGNPFQFDHTAAGNFEARRLENGVSISKIPSPNRSAIVWLDPEMCDFSQPFTVGRKRVDVSPKISVILEDVRGRGDRMHPFWDRIDTP